MDKEKKGLTLVEVVAAAQRQLSQGSASSRSQCPILIASSCPTYTHIGSRAMCALAKAPDRLPLCLSYLSPCCTDILSDVVLLCLTAVAEQWQCRTSPATERSLESGSRGRGAPSYLLYSSYSPDGLIDAALS